MEKFYTTKTAAEKLNVTEQTIKKWIYAGKLDAQKIGKKWSISEDNINMFIDAGKDHENS